MGLTTIGILGAGQAGSTLARAVIEVGYEVVIANSRGPHTLRHLADALGPKAHAADAAEAASRGDFVFLAFPYAPSDVLPVAELAGKIVIDNNNYMAWRDGIYPDVESGRKTIHELRQEQLPKSKIVKAFSHVQFHARHQIRVPSDTLPALRRSHDRQRRLIAKRSSYRATFRMQSSSLRGSTTSLDSTRLTIVPSATPGAVLPAHQCGDTT